MNPHETLPDLDALEKLRDAHARVREQIHAVVVGQDDVIDELMAGIFAGGHCILEGVPGLAKTLLVQTLAKSLSLEFGRIQFTPDLMPADITGTEVIYDDRQSGHREFRFVHGPIFTNLLLADEINRTPPKTQAALLEAMQERHVSSGTKRYPLPEPFFVLATQNPIEQEGTYALPEAQLDRFLFRIHLVYPSTADEIAICKRATTQYQFDAKPVLTADEILQLQSLVRKVPVGDQVYQYAVALARMTRPEEGKLPKDLKEMVQWGAGPRASIFLLLAAKARALLHKRHHATTDDVRAVALPVLRHRIIATFNAEAAGVSTDDIVRRLLELVRPAAA